MNEKEKHKPTERGRELENFSMMRFDFAAFSFLALLVIKSYRNKLISTKFKRKKFQISQ